MPSRETFILVAGLVVATALTLVGTYYVVNWISPPITYIMPEKQ